MQPIHGTKAENLIGRSDKEGNFPVLPSGKIIYPTKDYMAFLGCIGSTNDDEMMLHQRMSRNSNSNSKGTINKVSRGSHRPEFFRKGGGGCRNARGFRRRR